MLFNGKNSQTIGYIVLQIMAASFIQLMMMRDGMHLKAKGEPLLQEIIDEALAYRYPEESLNGKQH